MAETREQWLEDLVAEIRPWFRGELPETLHLSTGFPSGGARGKAIGECHGSALSEDDAPHIFVHPKVSGSLDAAAIMVHELIHAARPEAGHRKGFREVAVRLGLEGKMTATIAGPELINRLNKVIETIGEYPHAALTSTGKKQSTRLIKCECPYCGYVVRVTAKWLDNGEPFCGSCEDDDPNGSDIPYPVRMIVKA